jgi:hypothetical protein
MNTTPKGQMQSSDYAVEIAIEGIAYLFAKKMMLENTLPAGAQKERVEKELDMLQEERQILYGGRSRPEFHAVMHKVDTVYAPIIKNVFTSNASIGDLPTE